MHFKTKSGDDVLLRRHLRDYHLDYKCNFPASTSLFPDCSITITTSLFAEDQARVLVIAGGLATYPPRLHIYPGVLDALRWRVGRQSSVRNARSSTLKILRAG